MDNLTLDEVVAKVGTIYDPEELVEALDLTSEEIAEAFAERVWVNRERLLDE